MTFEEYLSSLQNKTVAVIGIGVSNQPLIRLLPLKRKGYGVVTTGSEIAKGLIEDTFTDVIVEKLQEYGCEMIFCTGGMSVDPDDRTPLAIRNTGAAIVSYGAPVLPGAMFLASYMPDGRPVCGLPGCVMYAKRTIFDLVLPRLLADVPVTADYV